MRPSDNPGTFDHGQSHRLLGRPVEHVDVRHGEFVRYLRSTWLPSGIAGVLADLDQLIRAGAEDRVSDTVERLTGRPPRDLVDILVAAPDAREC
ncbi:hypothetical protein [Amycolatopsis sp. lyj-90]|uniref:hypothetical protein n=1 Tax=Amycolatopsis sp. lyj-90 TaxID=2789285 RepID=UPI003979E0E4